MKPIHPCKKDCPRRRAGCHNRKICPEWGEYEDAYQAYYEAETAAIEAREAFVDVRRGAEKKSEHRRQNNERQKAAARCAAES